MGLKGATGIYPFTGHVSRAVQGGLGSGAGGRHDGLVLAEDSVLKGVGEYLESLTWLGVVAQGQVPELPVRPLVSKSVK